MSMEASENFITAEAVDRERKQKFMIEYLLKIYEYISRYSIINSTTSANSVTLPTRCYIHLHVYPQDPSTDPLQFRSRLGRKGKSGVREEGDSRVLALASPTRVTRPQHHDEVRACWGTPEGAPGLLNWPDLEGSSAGHVSLWISQGPRHLRKQMDKTTFPLFERIDPLCLSLSYLLQVNESLANTWAGRVGGVCCGPGMEDFERTVDRKECHDGYHRRSSSRDPVCYCGRRHSGYLKREKKKRKEGRRGI